MRITAGPMVQKYSERFEIPIDEVLAWMNAYVNSPDQFPRLVELEMIQPTAMERAEHIRAMIQDELS